VPLYEYKCLKCGRTTEKIENVSGPFLKKCPHCGGKVETLISSSSIQFKGSGWYVNDYARKSSGETKSAEKAASETAESKDSKEKASKDTATKETPSREKKSEKKK
jgi:putative FmdB family regulatory protein